MEVLRTDFWPMIAEIRAHLVATGEHLLSRDDPDERTLGFETTCPKTALRHRYWRIRLSQVSRTANVRLGRPFDEDVSRIYLDLLMNGPGRAVIAEALWTGEHPTAERVRKIREAIGGPLPKASPVV